MLVIEWIRQCRDSRFDNEARQPLNLTIELQLIRLLAIMELTAANFGKKAQICRVCAK